MRRSYPCPNCSAPMASAKALVRHLLEEAGAKGVTTSDFVAAGCGSRFGGRIHELRHDDGMEIEQRYLRPGASIYFMAPAMASASAPPAAAAPSAAAHQAPALTQPAVSPPQDGADADETAGQLFAMPVREPSFDELVPRSAVNDDWQAA